MNQAWTTLRPFSRYLSQAIHTAKQRQFRYQLPWEKVRNLVSIHLEPLDTWLRVPRRQPGTVLVNWPPGKATDLSQSGFVINRGVPFQVLATVPTDAGLCVRTNIPLLPADQVIWCGVPTSVQQEAATAPPRDVCDLQGKPLRLMVPPRADHDSHWLLLVEGAFDDSDLVVDGDEVEVEVLHTLMDARKVFDTRRNAFDVQGGTLRVEELPADGPLKGEDGVRYRWSAGESSGRRGCWIQLLPPDSTDTEDFIDPRAAF